MTSSDAAEVLRYAAGEVGYHEGRNPDGTWNNIQKYSTQVPGLAWSQGQPWCAVFVDWCFWKAGLLSLLPSPPSAWVPTFMSFAKQRGQWSESPSVGAVVIFGGGTHIGIVESFTASTVTTIEGNTTRTGASAQGDGVYRKTYQRTNSWVTGYLHPKFTTEDDVSAADVFKWPVMDAKGTDATADDEKVTFETAIRRTLSLAYANRDEIAKVAAAVEALNKAVAAISLGGIDIAALAKAVNDDAARRLAE